MSKSIQWLCIMFVIIVPTISSAQDWVVRYNGPGNDWDQANAIAIDDAGAIYVTGESFDFSYDYATVKYDSLGVEQWVARYDGTGNGFDLATAIAIDNTGNIYVTGGSHGSGTGENYATVKYDASGVEQWVARYHGPGNPQDMACAIAIDDAGAIYVTGSSHGSGTNFDYATVKYDSLGVEQWVARYDGPGSNSSDYAAAIAIDNTDNIYVTGGSSGSGTDEDYATVKYDTSGVEQWVARYNGPGNDVDVANAITVDGTGNICVTGGSYGSGTYMDYATIKYSPTGIEESRITQIKSSYFAATIFSGPLQLPKGKKCKVFDIAGRVVMPDEIKPGIYFVEVDGKITRKVVKVR